MHMHMCTRVLKGYKCCVGAEHTCFALVFTSEAVNKESAHPHTQVKKKKIVWVVQHCYPKPSFSRKKYM